MYNKKVDETKRNAFFVNVYLCVRNEDEKCEFDKVDFNKITSPRHFTSVFAFSGYNN